MTERVQVDGQAVTIGSKVYALENIALATVAKSPNRGTGIGMVLMGIVPLVILLATGNTNGLCLGMFGALAVIGVLVVVMGGSLWRVSIETKQGKRRRIWSAPEAEAQALADKINAALEHGAARVIE